jgi:hypothetical protein
MTDRYIVYFQPALTNLAAMGNRMSTRLNSQIEDFLTAWRPAAAFEKQLQSHLWQFKWSPRSGSGARAFSGYFDGEQHDIALVLVCFKKKDETEFYAKQDVFNSRAKSYTRGVLANKSATEIDSWLDQQRQHNQRAVVDAPTR